MGHAAHATQWGAAVTAYVDMAFDTAAPGTPATTPCTVTTCWQIGSRAIAFARSGARTALMLAADRAQAEALTQAIAGRP